MASSTKPTIILVPGAYHTSSSFDIIKTRLEALSYPVIALELATANAKSSSVGPKDDVAEIHRVMLPLCDAGKEVTIVAHSYGGFPAYLSTQGHSVAERAQGGKRGGVKSIVFLCAFAATEVGKTFTETNLPADVSWVSFRDVGFFKYGLLILTETLS